MRKTRLLAMLLSIVLILGAVPVMSLPTGAEDSDSALDQENAETVTDDTTGLKKRTSDGVYLIGSVEDWAKLAKYAMGSKCEGMSFELTANLNFSGTEQKFAKEATGDFSETNQVYAMIGFNETYEFGGTFDGKGHTISGLSISSSSHVGLFRFVAGATIKNVGLESSTLATTGGNQYVGGIVSRVRGTGATADTSRETVIENCTVESSVILKSTTSTNSTRIGGIVADATATGNLNYNKLTIRSCTARATLTPNQGICSGNTYLGGILGDANSHSTGYQIDLLIDSCVSTVTVDCKIKAPTVNDNISVGGIVGELAVNQATISNCYSNIAVNMDWTAGATAETKALAFVNPAIGGLVGAVNRYSHADWTLGETTDTKLSNCIAVVSKLTSKLASQRGNALAIFKTGGIAGYAGTANADTAQNNTVIENVFWYSEYLTDAFARTTKVSYAETGASGKMESAPCVEEKGYSISLNGDIAVNVYVKEMLAPFEVSGKTVSVTPRAKISTPTASSAEAYQTSNATDGSYKFSGTVAAKEMDETVAFAICFAVAVGENEAVLIPTGATFAHSVNDYLTSEDVANSEDAKLKALCDSMRAYGEYAKVYFSNTALSTHPEIAEGAFDGIADIAVSGSDENLTFRGVSLVLETKTALRVYFELADGASLTELTVTVNGESATPVLKGDGWYCVEVALAAKELSDVYTFVLGGVTVVPSAMGYCKAAMKTAGTSEALTDLIKALYRYGTAAQDYFTA